MLRTCLCLLIALASASVAAREVKLSCPNGGNSGDRDVVVVRSPARSTAVTPVRETKPAKPSVHSDAESGGRLQSPRWHSFLPGMIR